MIKGLSSNVLKISAIIIMLVDHIASYMYQNFDQTTYYALRSLGRMAMPIFSYLIVQGFFYTKNLSKYIFRIFILATFTQIVLFILGIVNQEFYPNYWIGVNNYLGVLYSYVLSLILIGVIDRETIIKKLSDKQNLLLRINLAIIIVLAYLNFKIEFDMQIPFIILQLYAIEKLFEKNKLLLLKHENKWNMKRLMYITLIFISFVLSTFFIKYSSGNKYVILVSLAFIALYNGERGKKNEVIKYLFYLVFPLQHIILYVLAMI